MKPMSPDMTKLDPFKGFIRMFSGRSVVELIKSVAKVGVVGYVMYNCMRTDYKQVMGLGDMSLQASGAIIAGMCYTMLQKACMVMLLIAGIDYAYQRYTHEMSLKMTKQEVQDEYKRSEGDPQIKGRIRQKQRDMVRLRMMQNVRTADVVVVNPTHFAVAIKYDPQKMAAPTVVAKGQRLVAQKIREIAESSGVPIVENIPVARTLYKLVEVGQAIPEELYQAVAEILAYVYRLNDKAGRGHRRPA
jgi:flagellar biosynthetic protein FlhB